MKVIAALVVPSVLAAASLAPAAERPIVLWEIGKPDRSTSDLALGPSGYADFLKAFPRDPVFVAGRSDPRKDWPYVHPGSGDAWAGARAHTFSVVFGVGGKGEGDCALRLHIADVHDQAPPRLRISVNGRAVERDLPRGSSPESIGGRLDRAKGLRLDVPFPASWLRPGTNAVAITALSGSWLLYDALALEGPQGLAAAPVGPGPAVLSVEPTPLFPRPAAGQPLRGIMFRHARRGRSIGRS